MSDGHTSLIPDLSASKAGQSRRKIFESGLFFGLGIFAWFVGLALVLVVLRHAGHQITWALQFTNPYFVLGMSAVVLIFALIQQGARRCRR